MVVPREYGPVPGLYAGLGPASGNDVMYEATLSAKRPVKGLGPLRGASRPLCPVNGPFALLIGPAGPVSMGGP